MFRIVFLQITVTLIVALLAGLLAGARGAASAALGGTVYALPCLLFATHLRLVQSRSGAAFTMHYLGGEFIKLLITFSLLAAIVRFYPGVHWPAMLCGLVCASQAVFLFFWKKN